MELRYHTGGASRATDQRYKERRSSGGSLDSAPFTSGPGGGASATPKESVDKDPPQPTCVFDKLRGCSPADDTTRTTDLRQSVDRERHSATTVMTEPGGDEDRKGTTVPSRSVSRPTNDDRNVVRVDSDHRSLSRSRSRSRDDRSRASSRDSKRHEDVRRLRGRREFVSDDNYDGDRSISTVRDRSPRPHGDVRRSRREFLGVQRRSEDSDRTTPSSHFHIDPALIAQITAAVLASTASTKKDSTTSGVHGPSTSTPAPSSTPLQSTSTMDCDDSQRH
ncbi:serine/arginine-rich splicing factor 4-like [Haliotis cracherodii]|uniref:serine/arginine-rich splicing factor 4-like n=1 Tax=Haliotis cracherodii TaxID=6455 RepID=UPI0039EB8AD1